MSSSLFLWGGKGKKETNIALNSPSTGANKNDYFGGMILEVSSSCWTLERDTNPKQGVAVDVRPQKRLPTPFPLIE